MPSSSQRTEPKQLSLALVEFLTHSKEPKFPNRDKMGHVVSQITSAAKLCRTESAPSRCADPLLSCSRTSTVLRYSRNLLSTIQRSSVRMVTTDIPYAADAEQPLSYDELEVSPFQLLPSPTVHNLTYRRRMSNRSFEYNMRRKSLNNMLRPSQNSTMRGVS